MSRSSGRWSLKDCTALLARPNSHLGISGATAAMPAVSGPTTSKYRSRRTVVDGISFDSKREAARYNELKLLRQAGRVLWFIMQVPFRLPGGTRWYADFLVVWGNGSITVEDTKGFKTETYRVKKREVEAAYGIEIMEL